MFKADEFGFTLGLCGSSTKIGIGAADWVTPHRAIAFVLCLLIPRSMPAKKVGELSVTVTRIKAVGATVLGGVVTPATLLGKSTFTLLPIAVLPEATELLKPFSVA